jgi:hypothetical protein
VDFITSPVLLDKWNDLSSWTIPGWERWKKDRF